MLVPRIASHRLRSIPQRKPQLPWHPPRRTWSSTAPVASPQSYQHTPALANLVSELDQIAPRIDIRADQIEVLPGPVEFYETLKKNISKAKKRIFLATLYIGRAETELISTIREALLSNGPDLRVSILTDALRGTRESPDASCASLLASLATEFPDQVEIRMYHTPNLTGLRKRFVPKRINEGWGLQHIKLYGTDDEIILSGANLSSDYFTRRQDRYHVFSSKRVTDYFARIHHTICSVSFLLQPDPNPSAYTLSWPITNSANSPITSPSAYIRATTSLLAPLITAAHTPKHPTTDTSLYPIFCHPATLNTELPALRTLLRTTTLRSYTFTAGYFNPHPSITASLLAARAPGTVLTASPFANGFYNSPGISGLLPAAYSHLSLRFLQAVRKAKGNIRLREWRRGTVGEKDGWTYHAKGLWITLLQAPRMHQSSHFKPGATAPPRVPSVEAMSGEAGPSAMVIGSSNYTNRSYGLDLEVGALVVTSDEGLRRQWKIEEEALAEQSREVGEEELKSPQRRVGWRVRAAMWIVKLVGGSL